MMQSLFTITAREDIFPAPTLIRASSICTACIGMVKGLVLRTALEISIPLVAFGWSPGQAPIEASIFKNNPSMIRSMQKVLLDPMRGAAGPEIENYFLTEDHLAREERFPYNVSPLAFLDYDEDRIISEIRALGWRKPEDTDPNSTNCLLNAFANMTHMGQFNFHPYAFELAKLVREGYMDRAEALSRIATAEIPEIVQRVRERLELD